MSIAILTDVHDCEQVEDLVQKAIKCNEDQTVYVICLEVSDEDLVKKLRS